MTIFLIYFRGKSVRNDPFFRPEYLIDFISPPFLDLLPLLMIRPSDQFLRNIAKEKENGKNNILANENHGAYFRLKTDL